MVYQDGREGKIKPIIYFIVFLVLVSFLMGKRWLGLLPTEDTHDSDSVTTNNGLLVGPIDNRGGVITDSFNNSVINVNKVAKYNWINKDSFVVGYEGVYGPGKYRTDLEFKADSPVLPNSVCLAIKLSSTNTKPVSFVSAMPSGGGVSYGNCFKYPTAEMTIQLITYGKPDKIEAQLRNE